MPANPEAQHQRAVILAELPVAATFRLPPSAVIHTLIEQIPGPHALTVAWCEQRNVERLEPTGRGTFRHHQDQMENTFSGETEVLIGE